MSHPPTPQQGVQSGESGAEDVTIANAHTVGDFQHILWRLEQMNRDLRGEIVVLQGNHQVEMAQVRVELRNAQQTARQAQGASGDSRKMELVDVKTMSPSIFSGLKSEAFKPWSKRVKAYTNVKAQGFRLALEASEKSTSPIDGYVIGSWGWADAVTADGKLYDMLSLVTSGDALGIVESVPNRGFEAWRLLNARFNGVGEMYSYDKMNQLMNRTQIKSASAMPAAIQKLEHDFKTFHDRTGDTFPDILKLPILLQMVPQAWKKEIETQFRMPGAVKTYDSLSTMLCALGDNERYNEMARQDNMDLDSAQREEHPEMFRPAGDQEQYTEHEWKIYADEKAKDLDELRQQLKDTETEVNWLGKGGKRSTKGGGKGNRTPGGGSGGGKNNSGLKFNGKGEPVCNYCQKEGHMRKDCKKLAADKKEWDAERVRKGLPPFVPKTGARRPADSLESESGHKSDWEEDVSGLLGDDDVPVFAFDLDINEFGDFDYDSEDEVEEECDFEAIHDDESSIETPAVDAHTEETSESTEQIEPTPEPDEGFVTVRSRRNRHLTPPSSWEGAGSAGSAGRITANTPMSELFRTAKAAQNHPGCKKDYGCTSWYSTRWDLIKNLEEYDKDDSDSRPFGSAEESAPCTDEAAVVQVKDEDAPEQNPKPKPASAVDVASQTDMALDPKITAMLIPVLVDIVPERIEIEYSDDTESSDISIESDIEVKAAGVGAFGSMRAVAEVRDARLDVKCESEGCVAYQWPSRRRACARMMDEKIDVSLSAGEIKARMHAKGMIGSDGEYMCSTNEVELSPVEVRDRRYRMRRGITMDSGAGDNVIPKRMINVKLIRPSAGSRRKLHYVSATDHRIPNEGEIDLEFSTIEGHDLNWKFQVADVNKPLGCVADRVDSRCRVVFDQDEGTGEDLSHIYDKRTRRRTSLRRIGKVWVLDAIVDAGVLADTASVFSRPR